MNVDKILGSIYGLIDDLILELSKETKVFATELEVEECADVLLECPIENYIGKHDFNYTYYIIRIESGVAYGVDIESGSKYEFDIGDLSVDCLLKIGSMFTDN